MAIKEQADATNHEPNIIFLWGYSQVAGRRDIQPKAPFKLIRRVGRVENNNMYAVSKYVRQWRLTDAQGWLILVASGTWEDTPEGNLKELFSNLAIARYGLHEGEEGITIERSGYVDYIKGYEDSISS